MVDVVLTTGYLIHRNSHSASGGGVADGISQQISDYLPDAGRVNVCRGYYTARLPGDGVPSQWPST